MNKILKKEDRSFIGILIQILDNQSLQNIIRKNEENNGFIILNKKEFLEKILLQYYKSKTFASFRRSSNSYGFQVYQLQNGQKLFINKNITSINQNIHKRCQNSSFQNYYDSIESENQILLLQLAQIKKNQQLMEENFKRVLSIQEQLTRRMKSTLIQYIQGILFSCYAGQKAEKFFVKFCFSIKNKQFKKYLKVIFKKALSLPDINFYPISEIYPYYNFSQISFVQLNMNPNFNINDFFSIKLFNGILNPKVLVNEEQEEEYECNLSNFFCFNQMEM